MTRAGVVEGAMRKFASRRAVKRRKPPRERGGFERRPAATYSPTALRLQYHRRERA